MQVEYEDPRAFLDPTTLADVPPAEGEESPDEEEEEEDEEAAAEDEGGSFASCFSAPRHVLRRRLLLVTHIFWFHDLLNLYLPILCFDCALGCPPRPPAVSRPEAEDETDPKTTPIPRRETTGHEPLPHEPDQADHQSRQGVGHDDQ